MLRDRGALRLRASRRSQASVRDRLRAVALVFDQSLMSVRPMSGRPTQNAPRPRRERRAPAVRPLHCLWLLLLLVALCLQQMR